ncbi:MIP/aquaporin family protein [Agreia sp. Leaf210]|nr:MIP/aquaporin family protein [Agreia sp. Leaf210]
MDNLGVVFLAELVGTALLVLLGCGVVANVALVKNKGFNGGFLMVNIGWGFAVFSGVIVSYNSGAHLNPAVTLGLVANGATEFGSGVPVNIVSILTYIAAQLLGAIIGAVFVWLAYKQHFDEEPDAANKLGVFSTGPAIRSYGWNLVTEVIGTFVLVFVVIGFGRQEPGGGLAALGALPVTTAGTWSPRSSAPSSSYGWNLVTEVIGTFVLVFVVIGFGRQEPGGGLAALGALPVAILVIAIGASLGGPTGYAINPARDLGPRIAHALLPIKGKGSSDWSYSWIPPDRLSS